MLATLAQSQADRERVFGAVRVHGHSDDGEKDTGPGNGGGLGYAGVGLSLRTYAGVVRGARDGSSARYSVLVPRAGELDPPILQAVLRGRVEIAGPGGTARPRMPIGLPLLDDEQLQLLRAWIAAGCPGPTETTSRPGIANGDGPIAKNAACEQRESAGD